MQLRSSDEGSSFVHTTLSEKGIKEYLLNQYREISENTVGTLLSCYKENNSEFVVPYQPPFPLDFNNSLYGMGYRKVASIYWWHHDHSIKTTSLPNIV